jgi:uncharacterized membrane protein
MSDVDLSIGGLIGESWKRGEEDIGNNLIMTLIYYVILTVAGYTVIGSIIVGGPLLYGYYGAMLDVQRGGNPELNRIFSGFNLFGLTFLTYIVVMLFVLLWTIPFMLLLIIPGIISSIMASIRYSLTFFVINDDPDVGPNEARKLSVELTRGHRWTIFVLILINMVPIIGTYVSASSLALLYDNVK